MAQVSNPVRWDLCMERMLDQGVTGLFELPPAGTLTGIARRALKGVETFALKTPDQLDEARAFCATHSDPPPEMQLMLTIQGAAHAALLGIGTYRASIVVPNSERSTRSSPPTSGSSSAPASRSGAGLPPRRPSS